MNTFFKISLASAALASLAACGGGDTASRLDLANPAVRFVHAAPLLPALSLFRDGVAQALATNVTYEFASNYADIDMSTVNWLVSTTAGGAAVGTVSIAPVRGNKYTIVALAGTGTTTSALLITDPYNKSLTSDSTRLRVVNASATAGSVDIYMVPTGTTSLAGITPNIVAISPGQAGPASGTDSVDVPGGTYQITITASGTTTPFLFKGALSFAANQDLLVVAESDPLVPGHVRAFVKDEGSSASTDIPAL